MSKMISATCENGVVTADGVEVPGATILGQGVGESSGSLFLDEERKVYVPKTSPDLDATLEQVIAALTAAASGLGAAASGLAAIDALAAAGAITSLGSSQSAISSAKSALETLKGQLK